jgi:hypothetical protein
MFLGSWKFRADFSPGMTSIELLAQISNEQSECPQHRRVEGAVCLDELARRRLRLGHVAQAAIK